MNLHAVPPLRAESSPESHLERALCLLSGLRDDDMLPEAIRHELAQVHAHVHACRSPETVARMEREAGLR